MKAFYAENLVTQSVREALPWDFVPTEQITAQIREVKEDRQLWYSNPATQHSFYTFIEGVNSNMRVSKENNPPYAIYGIPADFDVLKLPKERVLEAIAKMPIKPMYIEQSLGGNWRLVWIFPRPVLISHPDFARLFLERSIKWLHMDFLPALDEGAVTTTTRLLCNGCTWEKVGDVVAESDLHSFYFDCALDFNKFRGTGHDNDVPLDVVEAALREKYPNFDWPEKFVENSQGPTFWIPESTSPKSAIVKKGGMISFAAHAPKQFTPWSEILGPDFSKKWNADAITKATADAFSDGKGIWVKGRNGLYTCEDRTAIHNFLKVNCGLSTKEDKQTGISQVEQAMNHILFENRIAGAGPFCFQKPGIIFYQGRKRLNTYTAKPMEPAPGQHIWGPQGDFVFVSAWLDHMLKVAGERQFWHFIAWHQYYYQTALDWCPMPGQNSFFAGKAGSGKTLLNRELVGKSVGGFMDAGDFFLDKSPFNAYLLEYPHWVLDDDTPSGSSQSVARMQSTLKKVAANQDMVSNAKFQQQCQVAWSGRVGVTLNLDSFSTRAIGPMDEGIRDKTNIYRCNSIIFPFPSRKEVQKMLAHDVPNYLGWLVAVKIPDIIEVDSRYGFKSYQDETLLAQTHQSQTIATFKEVLIESLIEFFRLNPGAPAWKGTVSQLVRMLAADLNNAEILRTLKLDQANRYLEQIEKEGLIKCEFESGRLQTRIVIFPRENFGELPPKAEKSVSF